MKKLLLIFTLFLVPSLLLLAVPSDAAIPHLIRYQGVAIDKEKIPLEGDYTITFRRYDTETGGTPLWQETQELISVSKGTFSVLLGTITPLDLSFDKDYYLSVEIAQDGEMLPRQRITSVAYAYRAEISDNVSGIPVSQDPTLNNLLPLDSNGQLPVTVIPQGTGSGLNADFLDGYDSAYYLNLANKTGILPLQRGGTGAILTNDPGGILYCGTTALSVLPDGTLGKFLQSGGQGAPSWQKVNLGNTSNITGILPVTQGGTGLAATTQGDILYASGTDTLAKLPKGTQGQFLKQGASVPEWKDVAPALSNVVFCFGGCSEMSNDYHGFKVADSFGYDYIGGSYAYWFHRGGPSDKQTLIRTKFKKIVGISTVTFYAYIKSSSNYAPNQWAAVEVDIGGQTGNAQTIEPHNELQWVTGDINVSSLTNGSVYDVEIKLYAGGNGIICYLCYIIGIAS